MMDDGRQWQMASRYAPTWAYVVAIVGGLIFPFGLLCAALLAHKWPGIGWRWGLWSSVPAALLYLLRNIMLQGFTVGAVETLTSPALLGYLALCLALAWAVARWRKGRA